MKLTRLVIPSLALLLPATAASGQAPFEILPGPAWGTDSLGNKYVTGDMTVAPGVVHAYRWADGVLTDLGDLPGGIDDSGGNAITDDSLLVVGVSESANGTEGFLWEEGGGMVGLGDLPGGIFRTVATDISGDGLWICGRGTDDLGPRAIRWHDDGTIELLGSLPGGTVEGQANAISADGTVIVGSADRGSADGWWPFRWTAATGVQHLGDSLPTMIAGLAEGVSDDGQVVVGQVAIPAGPPGAVQLCQFRYTVGGQMENLGNLPGGLAVGMAMDCTADGSVVVGGSSLKATIWDEVNGLRSLSHVLQVDYGVDLQHFTPLVATGISGDGRVIVGHGETLFNEWRGFIVELWQPCTDPVRYCAANPNSTGNAEGMGFSGSTSMAANKFKLVAKDGVPGQFGLFFYGPNQIQVPFGDGFRCVGGGIDRLGPASLSDLGGVSMRWVNFDNPAAAQITVGSTWNFQHWYSDPLGPGGTGFNLSDGLQATFCP